MVAHDPFPTGGVIAETRTAAWGPVMGPLLSAICPIPAITGIEQR